LGAAPLLGASSQIGSNLAGLRGEVLPNALTGRPDVVGAQAALEARQAQVQVLRRERLPVVELQARRSAFFGRDGSYGLRAVVTLPLFDFGSLKRERRAAEAEVRAQEATINLLRSQVSTQVEQALLRLQQQRQTVERYRTGIVPLTLDLLRKTQIGYAQGASTYLEVLEAQRTLRQVQTEYLQALVGTRTQEAALEGALGATPSASVLDALTNPAGPNVLPGTAAPGTVPEGTIPPTNFAPLDAPGAPPSNTPPVATTNPTNPTGVR
jgi:outer membrane protein TolC